MQLLFIESMNVMSEKEQIVNKNLIDVINLQTIRFLLVLGETFK